MSVSGRGYAVRMRGIAGILEAKGEAWGRNGPAARSAPEGEGAVRLEVV